MKIEKKGNCEYFVINVGGNPELNPFSINIQHIRYIREFVVNSGDNSWAIFIGNKMFHTSDLNKILNKVKPGEFVMIGKTPFECIIGTSLSDKGGPGRYFINHDMMLFSRKFMPQKDTEGKDNNKKNGNVPDTEKSNKFMIFAVDGRTIVIENEHGRKRDISGSPGSGASA